MVRNEGYTMGWERTEIVGILPAVAHLKVVIFDNETDKPLKKMATFLFSDTVDLLNVCADGEDTLPAGNRVGADDGVLGD
jgi:hypothetical protein